MSRTHRLRFFRNMAVVILCLLVLWAVSGYPLPTTEMGFHRAERQSLAEESTIVFRCRSEGELPDPTMLLGVTRDAVHTSSHTHFLNVWPKNPQGPTLVILPSELFYDGSRISSYTIGLVAVDAPVLAESSRLTLTLTCAGEETDYVMDAQRQGEVFFFQLESRYPNVTASSASEAVQAAQAEEEAFEGLFHWTTATRPMPPYILEFFDADGNLMETFTN